jgi:hypothetical protein
MNDSTGASESNSHFEHIGTADLCKEYGAFYTHGTSGNTPILSTLSHAAKV